MTSGSARKTFMSIMQLKKASGTTIECIKLANLSMHARDSTGESSKSRALLRTLILPRSSRASLSDNMALLMLGPGVSTGVA